MNDLAALAYQEFSEDHQLLSIEFGISVNHGARSVSEASYLELFYDVTLNVRARDAFSVDLKWVVAKFLDLVLFF